MCTSPPCPNSCRAVTGVDRKKRQHMFRAYVKRYDEKRKQHAVPVGWWCPGCHVFVDDVR